MITKNNIIVFALKTKEDLLKENFKVKKEEKEEKEQTDEDINKERLEHLELISKIEVIDP